MATTAARMIQRRRTKAQWSSENPVLAAAEFGVESDTGLVKVGDGTTAWADLLAVGSRTTHDALYSYPADWEHNGTPVPETGADVGLPRVIFPNATTTRAKWVWAIPSGAWNSVMVRFAWHNETAGAGAVKWQFAYRAVFFNEANVDTGAMTTITIPAITAGAQFAYTYSTPVELEGIAIPDIFGIVPVILCSLSRLGSDGTDTLAGDASLSIATMTRTS